MDAALVRVLDLLMHSPTLWVLASVVPVAITVAGLAGWRAKVPGTLALAVMGGLLCLWMFVPVPGLGEQLQSFRSYVAILGWVWLVQAWLRLVLTEWPAPIWTHWIVGTVLILLPMAGGVVLIRGL